MQTETVIERVRRVAAVRGDSSADRADLEASLGDLRTIRAFCDASEAAIARRIAAGSSFPEGILAERSRESLRAASTSMDRSRTLDAVPELAEALDAAAITSGHVDVVMRGAKGLEPGQRRRLYDRVGQLIDVATAATVEQFGRRIREEINRIAADDGVNRLERQRRATSMSTWTDTDGMWNVRGRFDPVTALSVSGALDRAIDTLFSESVPDTCPSDPVAKQRHLRALAFARLSGRTVAGRRPWRPEFVAVIDLSNDPDDGGPRSDPDGADRTSTKPRVTWPISIDVPVPALAELVADADIHTIVVRRGVVLHAEGNLNLGRSTRLASRAQRRALRGLYSTCAVPGCGVHYDRCKLHHIVWWRHGGQTDLDNLLPVCSVHHSKIHDGGWVVELGPSRQLTLRLPDGTIRNTGPPHRDAA